MELLNKDIIKELEKYPIFSQDRKKEKHIVAKFFSPWAGWTWYVTEGEPFDDDWEFFGYVESGLGSEFNEWGYFYLSQLETINGPYGLKIERDLHFGKHTINIEGRVK